MQQVPDLWVLTVAPNSRIDEVIDLRTVMSVHADMFVTVTTQPDPIPGALLFDSDEINISKWWDLGLDHIAEHYDHHGRGLAKWDVLLIESDAWITAEDLYEVRLEMRRSGCIMAGADWQGHLHGRGTNLVRRTHAPILPMTHRLPGIASVVAGEVGMRHDSQFRWWYADDDYEWQHRVYGGTVLVGGTTVQHSGTTPLVGERAAYAVEDRERFRVKWGGTPEDGGRTARWVDTAP